MSGARGSDIPVIAVAAWGGGQGVSTVVWALAVAAEAEGRRVAVVDRCPRPDLAAGRGRPAPPLGGSIVVVPLEVGPGVMWDAALVTAAVAHVGGAQVIIVDSPLPFGQPALGAASHVVLPTRLDGASIRGWALGVRGVDLAGALEKVVGTVIVDQPWPLTEGAANWRSVLRMAGVDLEQGLWHSARWRRALGGGGSSARRLAEARCLLREVLVAPSRADGLRRLVRIVGRPVAEASADASMAIGNRRWEC
jgi:hypothetical protein